MMGREYTVRRFAIEVLGNSVSPLLLGYIEKGKRMPNEGLVRRLAVVRKQDPQELLALCGATACCTRSTRAAPRAALAARHGRHRERRPRGARQSGDRGSARGRELDPRGALAPRVSRRAARAQVDAGVGGVAHPGRGGAQGPPARRGAAGKGAPPRPPLHRPDRGRAPRAGARVLRPLHQRPARQARPGACRDRHLPAQPLHLCRSGGPAGDPEAAGCRGGADRQNSRADRLRSGAFSTC